MLSLTAGRRFAMPGTAVAANVPEMLMAATLVLASLLMRPMLLGQNYAAIGLMLTFAVCILFSTRVRYRHETIVRHARFAIVVMLFWALLCFQSYLLEGTDIGPLFGFVLVGGGLSVAVVAFANEGVRYWYFKFFVLFVLAQCISFIVSFVLIQVLSIPAIQLGKIPIQDYPSSGTILFPLTSIYRGSVFGTFEVPRLQGWFREPGIAQAFITWAIFSCRYYQLDRLWIKAILLTGLLGTLSATALPVFGAVLLIDRIVSTEKKRWGPQVVRIIGLLAIVALIGYLAIILPSFGILARLESVSFEDRINPSIAGMRALVVQPLGHGHANGYSDEVGLQVVKNSEVNIFAMAGALGVPGLLALGGVYWAAFRWSNRRREMLVLLAPFLLTWALTQPLLASPLLYVFMLQEPRGDLSLRPGADE